MDPDAGRRAHRAERAVSYLLAAVVLAPNLVFPYSEDAGLFAAVARYRLEGLALYRELFDQKPPAIFLQESLRIALLGPSAVAARLFELVVLVLASGAIRGAVRPLVPAGRRHTAENAATLGFAIAASSAFWGVLERGMVEVYQAAAIAVAMGALGPVLARPLARRAHLARVMLAAVALSWACWLKPQAIVLWGLAPLVLALDARRSIRDRARDLGVFVGATAAVSLPIVISMASRGELRDFVWTMTEFNRAYVASARDKPNALRKFFDIWDRRGGLWFLAIASVGAVVVLFRAVRRAIPARAAAAPFVALAWALVTFASGAFLFPYQLLVALPALAVLFAVAFDAATSTLGRRLPPRAALALVTLAVLVLTTTTTRFLRAAVPFARWTTGRLTTEAMHAELGTSGFFRYPLQREAARVVEARVAPDETFLVFGRAGVTYLFAGRRPASRQLATVIAWWPERTAKLLHEELVREVQARRPKLLLVRTDDAMPWFGVDVTAAVLLERDPQLGPYVRRHYRLVGHVADAFLVLERCPGETCDPA